MSDRISYHRQGSAGDDEQRIWKLVEQLLDARRARGPEQMQTPTLNCLYDDWIERRKKLGLRNTHNERAQLENHVLPVLGEVPLDEIRVRHVRDLIDALRGSSLAPRTVRSIYGTLHKLFEDLVVDELVPSTPCVLTKDQLPHLRDKDPEWRARALFTREELERLISDRRIPHDRRVLNAIKLLTGVRFGEAAGLRWRDLDEAAVPLMCLAIARSYNQRTKTDAPRQVPVHPVLMKILMEWKRIGFVQMTGREPLPDDLIVPSRRGRMRSRHQHRNKFLDDLERLGLRPRRVHDTRRTFITLLRVDGARRDVLKQITHATERSVMDLYTTLPWPTLCEAIRCLAVRRRSDEELSGATED
jgi:integrase